MDSPMKPDYEPAIRQGGSDPRTAEKLGNDNDPYPFIKAGAGIANFDEVITCVENFHTSDKDILHDLYTTVEYTNQVAYLLYLKEKILEKGIDTVYGRDLAILRNKKYNTAIEAITDSTSAIRSIFIKLTEYIRKVSASLSTWITNTADLHHKTTETMIQLEKAYYSVCRNKEHEFAHLQLDLDEGGCPTAKAIITLLQRSKELMEYLDDQKNPIVMVLGKLLIKAKLIYGSGDTSALDELLSKNEEDKEDTTILNDLAGIQEKFTGVGISFGEDMIASFENVLEYRQETLTQLGYDGDTIKKCIEAMPTHDQIEKCKFLCVILSRLATYFSAVKINDESGDTEKYDTYINTIPKILTIVISIYRTSIIAIREYTTIALDIEKSIIENLK